MGVCWQEAQVQTVVCGGTLSVAETLLRALRCTVFRPTHPSATFSLLPRLKTLRSGGAWTAVASDGKRCRLARCVTMAVALTHSQVAKLSILVLGEQPIRWVEVHIVGSREALRGHVRR